MVHHNFPRPMLNLRVFQKTGYVNVNIFDFYIVQQLWYEIRI